jgi:hypothetical protein
METPGTDSIREARFVNPLFRISAPETAVRLMGVVSMVVSRFSAVTTISSSCPVSERDCRDGLEFVVHETPLRLAPPAARRV